MASLPILSLMPMGVLAPVYAHAGHSKYDLVMNLKNKSNSFPGLTYTTSLLTLEMPKIGWKYFYIVYRNEG